MTEAEQQHVLAGVAEASLVAAAEGVADAVGLEGDGGAALDLAEPVAASAVLVGGPAQMPRRGGLAAVGGLVVVEHEAIADGARR